MSDTDGDEAIADDGDDDGAVADEQAGRAPRWFVWMLIVVATAIAMGAVLNTWVDRQLLDTDEWVEVSDRLLDDDEIRGALATYLVGELFRAADVQAGLEGLLPSGVEVLAGPLAATLEANAVPVTDRLLATPAVRSTWSGLNERAHSAFLRVVRDDLRDGFTTANGEFAIELDVLVRQVGERIGLPDDLLDRLETEDRGTLVIFSSEQLDLIQGTVSVVEFLSVFLLLAVVAIYAAAVWLSADRRRAVRDVGWAIVVAGLILLVVRGLTVRVATEQLAQADSGREAVASIVTITTNLLNELAWAGVAVGALLVAYAVLVGPTSAAARVRRLLAPVLTHAVAIYVVGSVGLLAILAFVPGFTLETWPGIIVFGGLAVAAIEMTRRFCVAERTQSVSADSGSESAFEFDSESDAGSDPRRSSEYTSID